MQYEHCIVSAIRHSHHFNMLTLQMRHVQSPGPVQTAAQVPWRVVEKSTNFLFRVRAIERGRRRTRWLFGEIEREMAEGESFEPLQRAASSIDACYARDSNFPELGDLLTQGQSGEYTIPDDPAWAPFVRTGIVNIPDFIFEQYNRMWLAEWMP